jgi:hypothetical protein
MAVNTNRDRRPTPETLMDRNCKRRSAHPQLAESNTCRCNFRVAPRHFAEHRKHGAATVTPTPVEWIRLAPNTDAARCWSPAARLIAARVFDYLSSALTTEPAPTVSSGRSSSRRAGRRPPFSPPSGVRSRQSPAPVVADHRCSDQFGTGARALERSAPVCSGCTTASAR